MKRIVLSVLALSMLAGPVMQAKAAPLAPQRGVAVADVVPVGQFGKSPAAEKRGPAVVRKEAAPKGKVIRKHEVRKHEARKQEVRKQRWAKGHRVPSWQRKHVVNDWKRHQLRRPPAGQHWVKIDNDYLLIGIASGVIVGLIAGR